MRPKDKLIREPKTDNSRLSRSAYAPRISRRNVSTMVALCFNLLGNLSSAANAAISYIQGAAATPGTTGVASVTYSSAQNAGDLNVVIVAWGDTASTIQSVTDSSGNTYVAATTSVSSAGNGSQQIFYAANISDAAAGSNSVSVTFSDSVPYPDVRIVEYGGIDPASPLDGAVGMAGTGTTQNSGALTTTSANDVLVAGNYLYDVTASTGSGYTQRVDSDYGEIVEDQIVTSAGSYSATSTQGQSGWWLMQMAAFRAAGQSGDTQPPTAPTGVTASAVSASQINLSWNASTDNVGVTGYRIESCAGAGCTSFTQVGAATTTTYSASGLSASTTYGFRVRANDAAGNLSGYSSTTVASTPAAGSSTISYVQGAYSAPTSGSAVTATYASAQGGGDLNVVAVGWSDSTSTVQSVTDTEGNSYVSALAPTTSSGNASQSIYYAKNITGATGGSNSVTVTFSTTVTYPVVSIVEYGGVDAVNPVDRTIGASGTGTVQNSGSLTTTNANDVLVAANYIYDVTTSAGAGYTQRVQSSGGDIVEDQVVTATGSYNATSTQGQSGWWIIQLAAFRAASGGSGGGDTQAPSVPANVSASATSASQVNLTWTSSTDNVGVTGYLVERCTGASCSSFTQVGTSSTASYSDTGLSAATVYTYRVRATDAATNLSGYSNTTAATTTSGGGGDTTPPSIPTGLAASATSSTQINLNWSASTDNVGVTGYLIERCQGAGCGAFTQIATATGTAYTDASVAASTSYTYRIRATDAAGNLSAYSATATAVTASGADTQPPSSPGSLTATPGAMQTVLMWSASTDNVGVTGYFIERCQGASCNSFAQIASVGGTTTTFTDAGITADASYSYRVRATDAANNLSGYSNTTSDVPMDCD